VTAFSEIAVRLSMLGKRANCQTLVSLTLARDEVPVPVGLRLFLPESWTSSQDRMVKAGVPEEIRRIHCGAANHGVLGLRSESECGHGSCKRNGAQCGLDHDCSPLEAACRSRAECLALHGHEDLRSDGKKSFRETC
jgi:hypothetical protein